MSHRLLEVSRCCSLTVHSSVGICAYQVSGEHSSLSLLTAIRAGFAFPNVCFSFITSSSEGREIVVCIMKVPVA